MAIRIKKSYKFAFRTTLFLVAILAVLLALFMWYKGTIDWLFLVVFIIVCFTASFFIIQSRIEKFIYRRIKRIYDDVSLLESSSLSSRTITTDMGALTQEIEKFAQDKKIEIDTLKIREEYRKDFLGNVAHELKTPLFMVQGYLETLLDGALDDKTVRKKYLHRANKAVDRLIYIVKDLDLITRLEAGELNVDWGVFDIIELIQNVFDLIEIRATKKKITLTFDSEYAPIYVHADSERIRQVVTNLLVNSIKYGHENGTTEISVENLIQNKVIIRITDNGEGIPEQHIPRLFERFYRVDTSRNRKEGGSGLGLAIVKHIIEAHEERIYIESEEGIGSEFSFTLEKTSDTSV